MLLFQNLFLFLFCFFFQIEKYILPSELSTYLHFDLKYLKRDT
jgi:hypothetical protein